MVRRRLLSDGARLVTLLGPPGVGKTRLSLAVAEDVLEQFDDGVFFVRLGPISDPDQVAAAIAQTLGLQMSRPQPAGAATARVSGGEASAPGAGQLRADRRRRAAGGRPAAPLSLAARAGDQPAAAAGARRTSDPRPAAGAAGRDSRRERGHGSRHAALSGGRTVRRARRGGAARLRRR